MQAEVSSNVVLLREILEVLCGIPQFLLLNQSYQNVIWYKKLPGTLDLSRETNHCTVTLYFTICVMPQLDYVIESYLLIFFIIFFIDLQHTRTTIQNSTQNQFLLFILHLFINNTSHKLTSALSIMLFIYFLTLSPIASSRPPSAYMLISTYGVASFLLAQNNIYCHNQYKIIHTNYYV